ncbi:MAG: anti-sigma factor domain-containing protein, partial [Gammaproteobacteria bacterium]
MKLQNSQLQDMLAAEYVLGTLHGRARIRFEYYLALLPELRSAVESWSEKLHDLDTTLKPIKPNKRVWKNIEHRLGFNKKPGWISTLFNSISFWQFSSAVTAGFAVVMMAYIVITPVTEQQPQYVTVINNQQSQSSWLVSVNLETASLQIKSVQPQKIDSSKSFELWLLPAAKQAPISMGLMPASGKTDIKLSKALFAILKQNMTS